MGRLHCPITGPELRKKPCYGGLDLSSRIDLTAFSLVWPVEDRFLCAEWYWMPSKAVRERTRKDGRPYEVWVRQGWIEAIEGPVVDERIVRRRIEQLGEIFDIREIAYDKFRAQVLQMDLTDAGFQMIEFGQTTGWYDEPTKRLLELILQRRIVNEPNPVTRFCADCVSVRKDVDERIKPVKPDRDKSGKRIDGIVTRIMALAVRLRSR
ncbi:MAG TPA: terminase TerL endonuclease subunit [Bryobacteraceae bacterium]|nr:terminase TerL endonuclease subunit [Bryobacteraceae bacterium]